MSADILVIDHCVCKKRSFADLISLSLQWDRDPVCVMVLSGAGLQCGRCRPWLEQAIAEGRDSIAVDLAGQADRDLLVAHFGRKAS